MDEVINKTENPDSIEYRIATGKGFKVYGDASDVESFRKKLKNAKQLLEELEGNNGG